VARQSCHRGARGDPDAARPWSGEAERVELAPRHRVEVVRRFVRVQELLAAHEPPDDLDAVTRRQLDDYCLS
jgi:hypothetical protein